MLNCAASRMTWHSLPATEDGNFHCQQQKTDEVYQSIVVPPLQLLS